MSVIDGMLHRLRVLWSGERYAEEQEREMEFHLDLDAQAHANAHAGEDDEPRRAARRAFGNLTVHRESARAASVLNVLDRLRQDARYALRGLRRQPAFTAMVVITLALGFGVNAAMFSLLDALYLHVPDGIQASAGLRRFYQYQHSGPDGPLTAFSGFEYPQYRAMLAADSALPIALVGQLDSVTLGVGGARVIVQSSEVSRSYFSILGVHPLFGRFFLAEEDSVATPTPVAVISEPLWRTVFASDPHVLGRRITIDRRPFTIVGVAARGFRGIDLDACDVWVPWNAHAGPMFGALGIPWYDSFGISARLIGRVSSPSEETKIDGIIQRAMRSTKIKYYSVESGVTVGTGSIIEARGPGTPSAQVAVTRRIAWVALLVLAIAVANVVNLLLLRAARRKREMALRRALGVSRVRLLAQLTVEGLLLALLGAAAAVVVALWAGTALRALVLPAVNFAQPAITLPTILFLIGLSLATGVLAGIAPALQRGDDNLLDSLRSGPRDSGYRGSRTRSSLLALQAALCVVLLVGAGLFVRSLANVRSIDLGYDIANVTNYWLEFDGAVGDHFTQLRQTMPRIAREIQRLPGVSAVAYASLPPMNGYNVWELHLPGRDSFPYGADRMTRPTGLEISPTFFDAVGMHLVVGRPFTDADNAGGPRTIIVNETFARRVWPGQAALGKCVIVGKPSDPCSTVVGIVRDAHRMSVIEPHTMTYYLPITQPTVLIVRSQPGASRRIQSTIVRRLREAFPAADEIKARPLSQTVAWQTKTWSLGATLFTAFGVLAFLVAGVGVYSVVAYGVAQRTHEMGIRIALGAKASEIVDLVLADGLRAVAIGIAIGLIAALLLGRFIASLLFGVMPDDPSVMILVAVSLCVLGAVASLVPALRASRVDPMVALRSD